MEAIVLGGGRNTGSLKDVDPTPYEAGIRINNRPMVEYIIEVLDEMEEIERVLVVIPPGIVSPQKWTKVKIVAPGESMIDSMVRAVQHTHTNDHVLVVASDIPFITKEAIRDFLDSCRRRPADVYYSFVPKAAVLKKYPSTKRTYVRLKEGVVTGGNILLIRPRLLLDLRDRIEQAISLRKHPLKLCRLLGFKFVVKLIAGQLGIGEIEARVGAIFNVNGAGIRSLYPEIGVDVDKPSDLSLARGLLGKG
ncbi:MAG TPA: NTP transferase domain-containing protein [Hydrogenispora sp.]|jgi:GTP:adenosylcobinamide-phosphate guanylyltransferase|nr:NTP transferase domain-containing protein [Hydrogenispora sp.]